jgi:hypothetical protein
MSILEYSYKPRTHVPVGNNNGSSALVIGDMYYGSLTAGANAAKAGVAGASDVDPRA